MCKCAEALKPYTIQNDTFKIIIIVLKIEKLQGVTFKLYHRGLGK